MEGGGVGVLSRQSANGTHAVAASGAARLCPCTTPLPPPYRDGPPGNHTH